MEVIVAENIGFCFGVKKAIDAVYEQVQTGGNIYTYGAITHNEEVVKDLEKKGVGVLHHPMVPSTSGCPAFPTTMICLPAALSFSTISCIRFTKGQVASTHLRFWLLICS